MESPKERKKWSDEEDETLKRLVNKYGTKAWTTVASFVHGRDPKQCRERYVNHVDPEVIKGPLSESEWELVMAKQRELGNRFVLVWEIT